MARAFSISAFSSSRMPSTKSASAVALRAFSGLSERSAAAVGTKESSWLVTFFAGTGFVESSEGEAQTIGPRQNSTNPHRRTRRRDRALPFFPKIMFRIVAAGVAARNQRGLTSGGLRLVAQTLLVAVLLHALAALVFGDLRLPAF